MEFLVYTILGTTNEFLWGKKDDNKARKHLMLFEKIAKTWPYLNDIQEERKLIALVEDTYSEKKAI